jgi:hypothetical protein
MSESTEGGSGTSWVLPPLGDRTAHDLPIDLSRLSAINDPISTQPIPADDLVYRAWVVIANVDWERQAPEWQRAAINWRDSWHATLDGGIPG